ncbi:MAG: NEW3 domain-containing protein [Candidatus ainarchaeum sp.]|nr:NEW3 domain-containing protein [Candidatus ainarchaeum sp.]
MKKMFLYVLAFAAMLGVSFASVNPKIELVNYSLSEVPLQPGHVVNLTLQLKSIEWDNCADRVSVQIATSYPLSIQGPDTQYIDRLCYQDPDEKGRVTFMIPVDALAQAGTFQVSITTIYEKRFTQLSSSNTLNLRVGGSPSFQASVASSNPVDIYAGDSAVVNIVLYNNGSDRAESVKATLSAPSGIDAKWATSVQQLGTILTQGSGQASFAVEVNKDAAPGNYTLALDVDYQSSDGLNKTQQFQFVLPVKEKADFSVQGSAVPLHIGETEDSVITVRNTGSQEARKIKVRIQPMFPFSSDGTVRYVDSLAPGKQVNLTYSITVDSMAEAGSAQTLGLLVDYEDPQGNAFSDSADFSLSVTNRTLTEKLTSLWYIWALVGLAVVLIIVRRIIGMRK